MFRSTLTAVVFALASALSAPAQSSVICSFSGTGLTGTDCLGQTWRVANGGWGIPGIGFGTIPFQGGGVTATDFHITFFASGTFDGLIGLPPAFDTRLLVSPFGAAQTWNVVVSGGGMTVDYTAPLGAELATNQQFFVNAQFLHGLVGVNPADVRFIASWTRVPEPGTLALFSLALVGLCLSRRMKK